VRPDQVAAKVLLVNVHCLGGGVVWDEHVLALCENLERRIRAGEGTARRLYGLSPRGCAGVGEARSRAEAHGFFQF
jgi:hypothetical protein